MVQSCYPNDDANSSDLHESVGETFAARIAASGMLAFSRLCLFIQVDSGDSSFSPSGTNPAGENELLPEFLRKHGK